MNERQNGRLASLNRVDNTLKAWKVSGPQLDGPVKELRLIVKRIASSSAKQYDAGTGREGFAIGLGAQRRTLRDVHMHPISARRELLTWAPNAERALRLPHASVGNEKLLVAAKAMADAVGPRGARVLVKDAKFPKDFLEKLRAAIAEFEAVISGSVDRRSGGRAATAARAREVREGRKIVEMLNGLLKPRMRSERGFAEAWEEARRIPKKKGRPRTKNRRSGPKPASGE